MLCIKKSVYLSIFAFFAVLFGSCIITSKSVSAVSDFSGSFDNNSTFPFYICYNSSSDFPNCSDYNYIILTPHVSNSQSYQNFGFTSTTLRLPVFSQSIIGIASNVTNIQVSSFPYSGSFDFLLTDSYSSCPPVEPCPEIPENPYDNKFDEIKQAILIIPATALVIYFFFCIYRMLLKGRE